jgi:hypothetical protein
MSCRILPALLPALMRRISSDFIMLSSIIQAELRTATIRTPSDDPLRLGDGGDLRPHELGPLREHGGGLQLTGEPAPRQVLADQVADQLRLAGRTNSGSSQEGLGDTSERTAQSST